MLHELLTRNRDEIVRRCAQRARIRHPEISTEELLSTIPAFLDELIKAERREAGFLDESRLPGKTEEARKLGEQRFRLGFRIRDLAADFGDISQVIGELAIETGSELDGQSYKLLNQCLDCGIAQSISEFFDLSHARDDRDVAQWLGYLTHELRNAAASATLAFGALREGEVGIHSKTARVLERSLALIGTLVAETLVAVQLKSGSEPARVAIDLSKLLEDVDAGLLHERDIAVSISIPSGLGVIGDPRLLGSALTNLVQNALKFTHAGGRIEVRAAAETGSVAIEIEDQCGGLTEENPEQLFAPFVQRDAKTRGVGLGLAIARQAIEASGGTISVRNLPGHGCVFRVVVPARS
jgi:signal transduction histidine kinase